MTPKQATKARQRRKVTRMPYRIRTISRKLIAGQTKTKIVKTRRRMLLTRMQQLRKVQKTEITSR